MFNSYLALLHPKLLAYLNIPIIFGIILARFIFPTTETEITGKLCASLACLFIAIGFLGDYFLNKRSFPTVNLLLFRFGKKREVPVFQQRLTNFGHLILVIGLVLMAIYTWFAPSMQVQ